MRKIFNFAALALILLLVAAPIAADGLQIKPMSAITDLLVGTSAVNDTTTAIDVRGLEYLGAVIDIDYVSGGTSGDGYVYFEACAHDTSDSWVKLWVIDMTDSMEVKQDIRWTATLQADMSLAVIITAAPSSVMKWTSTNSEILTGAAIMNVLPFKKVRMICVDEDWNAVAAVQGYWAFKN